MWFIGPQAPASRDRASASFDVRHSVNAGLSWEMPAAARLRSFGRGWNWSGTLRARTGFPIDILDGENLLGIGFDNLTRPDLIPGLPLWLSDAGAPGGRRLNRAAFVVPANGQGTLGRNAIAGFGLAQFDLAVQRRFALGDQAALEFRAESINALNHPGFADPVRFLDSPLFGQPASMLQLMLGSGSPHSGLAPVFQPGGPRSMQATLRFVF